MVNVQKKLSKMKFEQNMEKHSTSAKKFFKVSLNNEKTFKNTKDYIFFKINSKINKQN